MSIKKASVFIISAVVSTHIFAQSSATDSIIYKCFHNGTELISNRKINKSCQPIIYKKIKKNTAQSSSRNNKNNKNITTITTANANNSNSNYYNNNSNRNIEVASVVRTKNKHGTNFINNNKNYNNYDNFYNYNNSNNSIYSYENDYSNLHNSSKSEYPKIHPLTQKSRDNDRYFILNQELIYELEALKKAESELAVYNEKFSVEEKINHRDKIERHRRNIAAIRKELRKKR